MKSVPILQSFSKCQPIMILNVTSCDWVLQGLLTIIHHGDKEARQFLALYIPELVELKIIN